MTIKKLKVVTVVGTRPEIIRLSRVMVESRGDIWLGYISHIRDGGRNGTWNKSEA